jgi:hypothetical protein
VVRLRDTRRHIQEDMPLDALLLRLGDEVRDRRPA